MRSGVIPSAAVVLALILGAVGAPAIAMAQTDASARPVPESLDGREYLPLLGDRVTVWHVGDQEELARRMLDLLDNQSALLALPDSIPSGVHAVLAHSPEALDAAIGSVSPEWRAGVAVPSRSLLVIPSGEGAGVLSGGGLRTLRHEWAHLGLHQFLGGLRVPRWFSEGYAERAAGGFDAMEAWRLRVGLALGRAPPMDSLALRWPRRQDRAQVAYLLSASAVTYLMEESGERGLRIFLERWRGEGSFETALRGTFGVTSGQLEEDWRAHVRSRYGWLFVLAHSSVFWLLLGVVLIYMVRARRARNEERLARLRAEEVPERPAYWNLEPVDLRWPGPNRPGVDDERSMDPDDRPGG
jgi:hypothetical protein